MNSTLGSVVPLAMFSFERHVQGSISNASLALLGDHLSRKVTLGHTSNLKLWPKTCSDSQKMGKKRVVISLGKILRIQKEITKIFFFLEVTRG